MIEGVAASLTAGLVLAVLRIVWMRVEVRGERVRRDRLVGGLGSTECFARICDRCRLEIEPAFGRALRSIRSAEQRRTLATHARGLAGGGMRGIGATVSMHRELRLANRDLRSATRDLGTCFNIMKMAVEPLTSKLATNSLAFSFIVDLQGLRELTRRGLVAGPALSRTIDSANRFFGAHQIGLTIPTQKARY